MSTDIAHCLSSLQQKHTKEQHGYTYKKSLNKHINITFKNLKNTLLTAKVLNHFQNPLS